VTRVREPPVRLSKSSSRGNPSRRIPTRLAKKHSQKSSTRYRAPGGSKAGRADAGPAEDPSANRAHGGKSARARLTAPRIPTVSRTPMFGATNTRTNKRRPGRSDSRSLPSQHSSSRRANGGSCREEGRHLTESSLFAKEPSRIPPLQDNRRSGCADRLIKIDWEANAGQSGAKKMLARIKTAADSTSRKRRNNKLADSRT